MGGRFVQGTALAELGLGDPGDAPAHAPPVGNRRLIGETGSKPVEERDGLGVGTVADAGPGVALPGVRRTGWRGCAAGRRF